MIVGVKDKSYEERLKLLCMTTLETRRIRGGLIETIKGFDKVDMNSFLKWQVQALTPGGMNKNCLNHTVS